MELTLALLWGALGIWGIILLLPWQPWHTREHWDVEKSQTRPDEGDLSDLTVLIPARNEAEVIQRTLKAIIAQGGNIRILLVDDCSVDGTRELAASLDYPHLHILPGTSMPEGWSGKLWALEQGWQSVQTTFVLLLDADIEIKLGVAKGLKNKLLHEQRDFVSLMAWLKMERFWEKWMMPAFIYYFKMLYPFRLANSKYPQVAAAAGGCILTYRHVLEEIGGFAVLKSALIDDCTLARKVKDKGFRTWLGLTHSIHSIRNYEGLGEIWNMVARTAYTQLRYSPLLLWLCTFLMVWLYLLPLWALFASSPIYRYLGGASYLMMTLTYLPTLSFYGMPLWRGLSLPVISASYLAMTWTSALRYWRGERMRWRGRVVHKIRK